MRRSSLVLAFLVLLVLSSSLFFLQNLDIDIGIPATGRFILIGSGVFSAAGLAGIGSVYLLARLARTRPRTIAREAAVEEEKERGIEYALDLCEEMLYSIREIEGKHMSEKNTVKYTIKNILPPLLKLMEQYKEFVHDLPKDYKNAFYDVYVSIAGKHSHYHPKRMAYEFRHLKESLEGILKKYKMLEAEV